MINHCGHFVHFQGYLEAQRWTKFYIFSLVKVILYNHFDSLLEWLISHDDGIICRVTGGQTFQACTQKENNDDLQCCIKHFLLSCEKYGILSATS